MTRSVFGWSASPGGSEWYRLTLPFRQLHGQYGWDYQVSNQLLSHSIGNGQRFSIANPADIMVVQRPMTEVAHRAVRHWTRRSTCAVVVELDDDLLTYEAGNPVEAHCTPERRQLLADCLSWADLVTVTNTHLAEVVNRYTTAPIRVVPNQVPVSLIDRPRPRRHGKITVGWQGSNTHADDWLAESRGIAEALAYSDRLQFHCMGWDYRGLIPAIRCRNWFTPFQPNIGEYYKSLAFDIALAPLRDTVFNRSKSDIRVVEAAAIGAVPIMSDAGPYSRVSGRHVRKSAGGGDTWRQHVADLVSTGETHQLADERATWKEWARRRTMEGNAWRWHELYSGVLSSGVHSETAQGQ